MVHVTKVVLWRCRALGKAPLVLAVPRPVLGTPCGPDGALDNFKSSYYSSFRQDSTYDLLLSRHSIYTRCIVKPASGSSILT